MKNFVKNFGGSIVSKNIINGNGKLKWCFRDEPMNSVDNGWRFFSDIDTEEFLDSADNMQVLDWNSVVEIEPAVLAIFDLPIGSDLMLLDCEGKKTFIDSNSGEKVI